VERDPKTENSFRILKVPKAIMKEVERRLHYVEMKKEWYAGNYEDHGYVSSREDGKPRGLSSMNQALTKLCERNGLPVRGRKIFCVYGEKSSLIRTRYV